MKEKQHIYVDASLSVRNGIGIWVGTDNNRSLSLQVTGASMTIIRLEVVAVRTALLLYYNSPDICIYSDNQHCVECLVTRRAEYNNNGWTKLAGGPVAERDVLIQCNELISVREQLGYTTNIVKVLAHSGNVGNEHADRLAYSAACDIILRSNIARSTINVKYYNNDSVATIIDNVYRHLQSAGYQIGIHYSNMSHTSKKKNRGLESIESYTSKFEVDTFTAEEPVIAESTVEESITEEPIINDNISTTSESMVQLVHHFLVCTLCSDIVNINNIPQEHSDDTIYGKIRFTRCRNCRQMYNSTVKKQNQEEPQHLPIHESLFAGSDILRVVNSISGVECSFVKNVNGIIHISIHEIFGMYNSTYHISSVNIKDCKLEPYLKAGFF